MKKITHEMRDEICDILYEDDGVPRFYEQILALLDDKEVRDGLEIDNVNLFMNADWSNLKSFDRNTTTLESLIGLYRSEEFKLIQFNR